MRARAPILCSVNEVLIYGLSQDKPPVVGEVEHVVLLLLPPVIPSVLLNMLVVLLPKNIPPLPSNNAHPVFVNPNIIFHAIVVINFVDLVVDPVELLLLVGVVLRLRAVVYIPRQLWGIQEGAYGDGVGAVVVVMQLADIVAELLDDLDYKFSAVVPEKVVITCYNKDIHRVCVVGIFQLKSMDKGLKSCTRYCYIICMLGISLVMSEGAASGGRSKKVVESGVRKNNLGSFCWIG